MLAYLFVALAASAAVRSGKTETALREPVSEKDHATQDAAAVLASLLKVLEQEQASEANLEDSFEEWCSDTQSSRQLLQDEVGRRIRETQTSLDQLAADEQRLKSEVGLSTSAQTDTEAQQHVLVSAQDSLSKDVDNELDLIARATELTRHAVRLARNHKAASGGVDSADAAVDSEVSAEEADEQRSTGLVDTLSALLEELDTQKQQVVDERDTLVTSTANLTAEAAAAGTFLKEASTTITVEGRERARAAARYKSELADLRRLVASVESANNVTNEVCEEERRAVRDHDGVTAAEMDAARTALESLGPADAPSFVQLASSKSKPMLASIKDAVAGFFETRGKVAGELSIMSPVFLQQESGVDKFTAFVQRMAKQDPQSPFAKAAAALEVKATPKQEKEAASPSDPLAEIAAFGAGEADESGDNVKVSNTYQALEQDLRNELAAAQRESALCADSSQHAASAVERMASEKSFADAKLAVLNTTAKELDLEEDYLARQSSDVNQSTVKLHGRCQEERRLSAAAEEQLKGFAQQLVSVSSNLARVGSGNGLRKVGKEVERLVERVEGHVTWLAQRSEQYASWEARVATSFAGLGRVLAVDLSHAKRKSNEYQTEKSYTESMDRAKARDAADAGEDEQAAESDCPPQQQQARDQKQQALNQQLHDLHVLWGTLRL